LSESVKKALRNFEASSAFWAGLPLRTDKPCEWQLCRREFCWSAWDRLQKAPQVGELPG